MKVKDLMRTHVATVSPEDNLTRAHELMCGLGVRALPVIAGDRLIGIVTRTET